MIENPCVHSGHCEVDVATRWNLTQVEFVCIRDDMQQQLLCHYRRAQFDPERTRDAVTAVPGIPRYSSHQTGPRDQNLQTDNPPLGIHAGMKPSTCVSSRHVRTPADLLALFTTALRGATRRSPGLSRRNDGVIQEIVSHRDQEATRILESLFAWRPKIPRPRPCNRTDQTPYRENLERRFRLTLLPQTDSVRAMV